MKRLFTALLAATLAFGAVSCDPVGQLPDTDLEQTTATTYKGDMKVSKGGETTYEASDKECEAKYYVDSMTLTMYKMKFASNMPLSLDIVFPNIKFDSEAGYYYAEQVIPTMPDSEPITYVKITNMVIAKAGSALFVKFDCTMYGTTTYEVVYVSGEIDRPEIDDDDDDNTGGGTTPTPTEWDEYTAEMNVSKDQSVIYSDTAAVARTLVNEEAKSISATLAGVKFSAHMPLTLDLTFSDVEYDAEQERYCAATIVPTDADSKPITMVSIKNLSIYNPSEGDLTIIFDCVMGGNEYTINYSTFDSPTTSTPDDPTPTTHPVGNYNGDMSVNFNGAVAYADSMANVVVSNSADSTKIDILMNGVKFSPYMPVTIDLAMEGVEYNATTDDYRATELTPNDANGNPIANTTIKDLKLHSRVPSASCNVDISFTLIYNGKEYAISYYAELLRDTVE